MRDFFGLLWLCRGMDGIGVSQPHVLLPGLGFGVHGPKRMEVTSEVSSWPCHHRSCRGTRRLHVLVTPPYPASLAVTSWRGLSTSLGAAAAPARGTRSPPSPGVPAVPLGEGAPCAAAPGSSLVFRGRAVAAGWMGAE